MERGTVTMLSAVVLALVVREVSALALNPYITLPANYVLGFTDILDEIDCRVSVWSAWGPFNSKGYRIRTRTILRHPQNFGAACPSLTETEWDPWFNRSIPQTAAQMERSLISGTHTLEYIFFTKRQASTIKPRDFLFILDMSCTINSADYAKEKDNIAKLIGVICGTIGPGNDNNRAAVITFSTDPVINFDFNDHLNLADLQAAVRNLPKVSTRTCTGKALDLGQTMFDTSKGARSDFISEKEVILLTNGKSNCGPNAVNAALALRNSRTPPLPLFVFAIGNHNAADRQEIQAMASAPTSYHLFHFTSFIEFEQVVEFIISTPYDCAPIDFGGYPKHVIMHKDALLTQVLNRK
ncbi:collagen alpha-1(XII) chain-like isoform X2 [Liolophura sinensis]|uniref:collagen alpha-1(XII) chain-like isoform X2 n=1 Tax=Liolophura sinensis TaxID=3198878 RepID=UPI003158F307